MSRVPRYLLWGLVVGAWLGVADGAYALRSLHTLPERAGTMAVAIGLHVGLFALLAGLLGGIVQLVSHLLGSRWSGPGANTRTPLGRALVAAAAAGAVTGGALACVGTSHPSQSAERLGASDARPNVILISIDTLRPDHLGAYDYERATSPQLDQLAREGVLFETVYSSASWTLPAHASLLTGLDPFAHGAIGSQDRLHGRIETLAERLKAAGYQTEAWVGTTPFGYVGAAYGFAAGFDTYRHYPHSKPYRSSLIARAIDGEILRTAARDVGNARAEIDSVIRWLRGSSAAPFFLFVHLYDVHSKTAVLPYEAPPPFRDQFCPGAIDTFEACRQGQCATDRLHAMVERRAQPFSAEELEIVRCLYDGGIAFVDHELGRLFAAVDDLNLSASTVLIVTSDHGEAFFEHGAPLHTTLHDEIARVPLIIRAPGAVAGKRASGVVSLADIAPTILELAGIALPDHLHGQSLAGVLNDWRASATRDVIGVSLVRTLYRSGDMKYIEQGLSRDRPQGPSSELYQLTLDAEEELNRIEWDEEQLVRLSRALEQQRTTSMTLRRKLLRGEDVDRVELDDSERDALRALGYLGDDESDTRK
jgi:arylsulfatase A-like enzyme